MKLFFKFLYQYRKLAVVLLMFCIIYLSVFYLYNAPVESVFYGGVLCGLLGMGILIVKFIFFRKRHMIFSQIYKNLPLMTEKMPQPEDLTQKDLEEMVEKLRQINNENITRLKSGLQDNIDYFTAWSHQIKTPIAVMDMLLKAEDTPRSRELLTELFKIEQYAEMSLQYLRLDSNTNDFIIRECDVDVLIRKAIRHYAPQFIHRKLQLQYTPVKARVITDEKWLLFIIEQLLSNAVKYTSSGTVTISFEKGILTVADTGIGIAPEDIPRIFEKGYTGLSGHMDRKSTGLGLYLCKKAADLLGHRLYVRSAVGYGSRFSVDLRTRRIEIE